MQAEQLYGSKESSSEYLEIYEEKADQKLKQSPRQQSRSMNKSRAKMQFDPNKAPVKTNLNKSKSQMVIDAQIIEDKARSTKAKQKIVRRFERNFNKWREYDLLTCMISIVGLAIAIVDWEYTRVQADNITHYVIGCDGLSHEQCMQINNKQRLILGQSNFVRVVIMLVSVFGIITLQMRHAVKAKWLNEDLPAEILNDRYYLSHDGSDEIVASGFDRRVWFKASFWYEAIIFLVCPIPFNDWLVTFHFISLDDKSKKLAVQYLVSDFILVFMFLRIFFIIRAIFNYNMYTDVFAKKLCRSYGFTANVRFTFKSLLKTDPTITVSATMLGSVLILAYMLRVFEYPYYMALGQRDFNSYSSALWCVIITMTTVGYGDMYPVTIFGRLVGVICALWGTFIISLLIIVATEIFALSHVEQKALHHLLQTRKAAQTITNSMRYFISKQRYLESYEELPKPIDQEKRSNSIGSDRVSESNLSDFIGLAETSNKSQINQDDDEDERLVNFDDGVELSDVTQNYRKMLASLKDFKEQKQTLRGLRIGDDSEQINLQLIKMQVLDMAERFDSIEETQRMQSVMLGYLVESQQRNGTQSQVSQPEQKKATMAGQRMSEREFASLFRKQEEATEFKLSEKEIVLPQVVEEVEGESQDEEENKVDLSAKGNDKLEKLQADIMEAQRKLFRLQAEYNEEMVLSTGQPAPDSQMFMALSQGEPGTHQTMAQRAPGQENNNYARSAFQASEIAKSVQARATFNDSEGGAYQMRRSPFVQRQMAKGKRFDRRSTVSQINIVGGPQVYQPVPDDQSDGIELIAQVSSPNFANRTHFKSEVSQAQQHQLNERRMTADFNRNQNRKSAEKDVPSFGPQTMRPKANTLVRSKEQAKSQFANNLENEGIAYEPSEESKSSVNESIQNENELQKSQVSDAPDFGK